MYKLHKVSILLRISHVKIYFYESKILIEEAIMELGLNLVIGKFQGIYNGDPS